MAASAYTDTVQKVYIAYYGRAADPVGLAYWSAAIDTAGGSLSAIMASFGASAEATTLYGSLSNTAKVNAIYQQSFGRDADFAGLMYYAGQLSAGTMTAASIAQNIFDGASGNDATILTNKLVVAKAYTAAIDTASEVVAYSGTVSAAAARATLATVDATTVTASFDVATAVASVVSVSTTAATAASDTAVTIALTTAVDDVTGTSANDTFNALAGTSTSAATDTLTASDIIDGGAGTDTLNITTTGVQTDVLSAALVSNIEIVNIRATTATVSTLAAGNITGLTEVNAVNSTGTVTVTGLASGATHNILGNGSLVTGALNSGWAAAATASVTNVTGAVATSGVITLSGTGLTSSTVNSLGTVANTVGAVAFAATTTGLTINSGPGLTTGALTNTTAAAITAIDINGAGAVNLSTTALETSVIAINAGNLTGGLTVKLSDKVTMVATAGSGDDVITSNAILTTGSVNAGAGDDLLVAGALNQVNTAALGAKFTNFETLRTIGTLDMDLTLSGLTGIQLTGATNNVTNLTAAQAGNIKAHGTTIGATTFALKDATGSSDTATITLGTGLTTGQAADASVITLTGFETLNLITNEGPTASVTNHTSVVTGALVGSTLSAINLTGAAFQFTDIATTKIMTMDGTALTGDGDTASAGLTVAGDAKDGSTIKGSEFVDQFTLGGVGSTYQGNGGADLTIATAAYAAGSVSLDGGAGTDVLRITDLSATVATLTIADTLFKNVTTTEALNFSGAVAGDFLWTVGGYANAMATASGGTLEVTGAAFATAVTGDIVTIDASGLGGTNAIHLTLTNSVGKGSANTGAGTFTGAAGNDTFAITYDTDHANAQSVLTINGGAGNDTISLTSGTIAVGVRNLNGDAGNDTITGSAGADLITGGSGQDTMTGGADADIFHVASGSSGITLATADTITDFTTVADDLDVGTGATYTEYLGTSQTEATFLVAAAAAFDGTGTDAYVSVNAAGSGNAWVLVDMDASGTVSANDTWIVLTGINAVAEIITGDII